MKDNGIVQGSEYQAKPLVVGKDLVYVHTDIEPAKDAEGNEIEGIFQYHEKTYTKDEYLDVVMEENAVLKGEVTDLQLAMVSLTETILASESGV